MSPSHPSRSRRLRRAVPFSWRELSRKAAPFALAAAMAFAAEQAVVGPLTRTRQAAISRELESLESRKWGPGLKDLSSLHERYVRFLDSRVDYDSAWNPFPRLQEDVLSRLKWGPGRVREIRSQLEYLHGPLTPKNILEIPVRELMEILLPEEQAIVTRVAKRYRSLLYLQKQIAPREGKESARRLAWITGLAVGLAFYGALSRIQKRRERS
ncbi:MAG: hypothetical protein AABW68_02010 [archaeon]